MACNSCFMGPQNITVGCSKSYAGRLKFKLNTQHSVVVWEGPTSLNNIDDVVIFIRISKQCLGENFEHNEVKILVFPTPTGDMLWSFGYSLINWGIFHKFKWLVIFLKSWNSTNYFSNSTNPLVISCQFSPFTVSKLKGSKFEVWIPTQM